VDDLKEKTWYGKLKEEALDLTLWRTRFGRGYGTCRKTDYRMNEWMNERVSEWMNERKNERPNEWIPLVKGHQAIYNGCGHRNRFQPLHVYWVHPHVLSPPTQSPSPHNGVQNKKIKISHRSKSSLLVPCSKSTENALDSRGLKWTWLGRWVCILLHPPPSWLLQSNLTRLCRCLPILSYSTTFLLMPSVICSKSIDNRSGSPAIQ
jgi:hypothetical protein